MTSLLVVANSADGGGAELSSVAISSELAKRGHEVTFIAINRNIVDHNSSEMKFVNFARDKNSSPLNLLKELRSFRNCVNEVAPEFVIYNCELPELFSLAQPKGPRVIVVEHTSKPWSGRRLLGAIVRLNLRVRGASWISVSNLGQIWPLRSKVIAVIPNPFVHNQTFNPKLPTISPRLIFIGRLNTIKNPKLVLHLAHELEMPCVVIGIGPEKEILETYAFRNNISADFLGYVKNPWELIQKTDLVIIPSEYEGDGMVIMESILNQVPMLLQDNQDLRRFKLAEELYCKNFDDYKEKIIKLNANFTSLVPGVKYRTKLLAERSLDSVADSWEREISKLSHKPIRRA
jgi:glycosyltransferase involved in cell wall biosynthesis